MALVSGKLLKARIRWSMNSVLPQVSRPEISALSRGLLIDACGQFRATLETAWLAANSSYPYR